MTRAIVATLPGRIEAATHDRAKRKPTDNMAAYECVLTAKVLHHRSIKEDNVEAQRLLDRAIGLDPNYAHAHAWKGCVLGQARTYDWCAERDATFQQVAAELEIALALDDNDSDVHRILAALNLNRDDHDKAAYHQERALALNPNDARHVTSLRVMSGYGICKGLRHSNYAALGDTRKLAATKASGRLLLSNNSAFSVRPITVSQQSLVKFPGWKPRKFGFEIDRTRALLARQVLRTKSDQLIHQIGIGRDAGHRLYDGLYFFTQIFVWHAEHSCIGDHGMRDEQVFALLRIDVDAA
jgi:tetratricopeptide (TPR) repeat protein